MVLDRPRFLCSRDHKDAEARLIVGNLIQWSRYCERCKLFSVVSKRKLKREEASDESPEVVVVAMTRNQGDEC